MAFTAWIGIRVVLVRQLSVSAIDFVLRRGGGHAKRGVVIFEWHRRFQKFRNSMDATGVLADRDEDVEHARVKTLQTHAPTALHS